MHHLHNYTNEGRKKDLFITIPKHSVLPSERLVVMSSRNTNQKSPVKENPFKSPVEENTEKPRKAQTLQQRLREEEEIDYDAVQGESNAVNETPVKETPTGETETEEDEQRLQEGNALEEDGSEEENCDKRQQGSQEHVEQTLPLSGFDFKHLKVLQNIPLSSFYNVAFDNLNLLTQPSSHVGSFYGLDTESLEAQNAALDELYAKIKNKKAACEKDQSSGNECTQDQSQDQSSGNKCSQDQSQIFLFPESATEEDDDIRTLKILCEYKVYYGSIPDVLNQPATTIGPNHRLLVYVDCKIQKGGCISGSQLTKKILKLQTKYKKLVAEKGKTPEHQKFSTPSDDSFFRLSRMTWERVEESDVLREVDVHCKDDVESETVQIGKLVIDDQE